MYDYSKKGCEHLNSHEEEEDVGTPKERQRILSALRSWAESRNNQNAQLYLTALDMRVTPGEIMSHIEDETAIGVAIIDVLVLKARELKATTKAEIKKFIGHQFPLTNFREIEED